MPLKFLQTTIQKSQKILQCISLESEKSEECNILLIFRNYAQLLSVDNSHQSVNVSTNATYPLLNPIVWCCIIGERIAAVTSDAILLMLDKTPPFPQVSRHVLTTDLSPSTIPTAFFAVSRYGEYIVFSGFTEKVIIVQFDSEDNPSGLKLLKLPNVLIHGVVATQNPRDFVFLISTPQNAKYLISFDVEIGQETRRILLADNYTTICSVFNDEGYSKIAIFSATSMLITWADPNEEGDQPIEQSIISLPTSVHSYFTTIAGELIIQLVDGECYAISEDYRKVVSKGSLPLISSFCCLPNNLLLCVSETSDSFFLPINFSSVPMLASEATVGFYLLPRTSIPLTPRITSAILYDGSMIVASGGNEKRYIVSKYKNSVSYSYNVDQKATESLNNNGFDINEEISLFYIDGISLIVSSATKNITKCLYDNDNIKILTNVKTLAFGQFINGDIVQIYNEGIITIKNENIWKSPSIIRTASINENYCIISLEDNNVILFDIGLNIIRTKQIYDVHGLTFCDNNYIAIASCPIEGGNPTITLYTIDLEPTDYVGQLTSRAKSIVFQKEVMEIYVSTEQGSVIKWTLGNDFSNSCANIFVDDIPSELYALNDYVMIVSNKIYLFNGMSILSFDLMKPKAICLTNKENDFFMIDNKNVISFIQIPDSNVELSSKCVLTKYLPRKVVTTDSFIIAIIRSMKNNELTSKLLVMNDNDTNNSLNKFSIKIPNGMAAISILTIVEDLVLVGLVTQNNTGLVKFLDVKQIDLPIAEIYLNMPPYALQKVTNELILIGAGQFLYTLRKIENDRWCLSEKFLAIAPTQIAFIEISDKFVWIGDRTQSIMCFGYTMNDEQFRIIRPCAIDPEPRQLTAMCLLNDELVAVGDKFGQISILRIPDELKTPEFQWRFSVPPNRGVEFPQHVSQLEKIASCSVSEAITSFMKSPNENVLFYTTLLGQIGAILLVENEDDFALLEKTELITRQMCCVEFGLTVPRKFELEKFCFVSSDFLDAIGCLQRNSIAQIESFVEHHWQNVLGLLCRIRQKAKF
ncbi:Splicing factor 3B subunit 3 [Histomonas meleagridis]|uniref:Splicing factor 3B subunit 3 n=1 Tax=Histomonas meleagridis TaxID=135588 RepID=UPI00355A02D0|nr:Splicing factor 3B subunit 3 [Histomonas meleagridis]KAH0802234.1 Splicing factor 3B subunit 3 [Histomonas meleagridis]